MSTKTKPEGDALRTVIEKWASKTIQKLHNRLIKSEDMLINYFVNNYNCDEEDVPEELCNEIYFLPDIS